MGYLALNAGDTALIILAAFWGLLVLFLCIVLLNTFRVLESTKMMIDSTREETVPLLREVRGSVERTNREIDRIDGILRARGTRVRFGRAGGIEPAREDHLGRGGSAEGREPVQEEQAEDAPGRLGERRVPPGVLGGARSRRRRDRCDHRIPMGA